MDLQPREARLIELIRSLPADTAREVEEFAAFKAARTTAWSYDDPASCAAAWNRAASHPGLADEVHAIQNELDSTEADGLDEAYE